MRLSVLVLVAACGRGSKRPADPIPDASTDAAVDAATDAGATPDRITVPATDGTLDLPFRVDIDGVGSDRFGDVAITAGAGEVGLDGAAVAAAVHERQPWAGFDWILYQTIAVREDAWFVLWFYCRDGGLEWIYYEGTDGTPMSLEAASGTCVETLEPSTAEVSFPAIDMPIPPLVDGFTIDGTYVQLDGAAPGDIVLGGPHFALLVFGTVDCTRDCGAPGWWELHALLWDREASRACFGILYLYEGRDSVYLTYSISLPDLGDPAGELTLDATWSH